MAAANREQMPPDPTPLPYRHGDNLQTPRDHIIVPDLPDDTSDDNGNDIESTAEDGLVDDADASGIIAFSIGEDQSLMRSPTTPAATKAQVLETSATYFTAELDGDAHGLEKPTQEAISLVESPPSVKASPPAHADIPSGKGLSSAPVPSDSPSAAASTSTSTSEDKHRSDKRSSLVSSIIGNSRKRSSSGSVLVDNIRRVLPNLTSYTHSGPSTTDGPGPESPNSRVLGPAGPGIPRQSDVTSTSAPQQTSNKPLEKRDAVHDPSRHDHELGGHSKDAQVPTPAPTLLRRATSDHSLYIRKAPTGASQFDDYNNFVDINDMVNSRFKALQDSFQDSSFRMPSFASMSRGFRNSIVDTEQDSATTKNTKANTGASNLKTQKPYQDRASEISPSTQTSRHPNIKSALSQMTGDLLIMGGYRGSILREAQAPNRQLWVPVKVGLNLRKADLEVGLTRDDEVRMAESIIPDGTLSHVGPVDICRRLIRKCQRRPNVKEGKLRVHDYGYDWRLSPDLLTDRLITYLESLPCNKKDSPPNERGAWIIAHSLGGLLVRSAINQRPELFAGIVYAGTPQNCVNILGPLRNGDDVMFSSRVLTAQVNFTLRTSYVLLPQNGRCFINKKTGEFYDLDFFNVKTWEEYCLSPCIKVVQHRPKVDQRRSIMGLSTEQSAKSIKANSWFSNLSKDEPRDGSAKSTPQKIKDRTSDVKEDITDTAEKATAQKPDGPMSPNMADGQQQKPNIKTQVTIPLPVATEYLSRTLASILAFKQGLSHNEDLQSRNAYPPASVLFAKNTPTVYGAFVESRDAIKYADAFDDLAFAAGDGVVLASAAQMPAGYRCVRDGRIESDRGHVGLLGDIEGVGRCLLAVIEARRKGVGEGARVS